MAIELRLEKAGGDPWGFKLTGGADLEVPLTVVKISTGGPAHKAGLQIGDVIIKVNESDLADLPHSQAQDAIGNSGEILILIIYRGELSDHQNALIAEEQSNEEVYKIMEGSIPIDYPERPYIEEQIKDISKTEAERCQIKHDLNLTDEEIRSIINPEITETSKSQIEQQTTAQIETNEHQESHSEIMYVCSAKEIARVEYQETQELENMGSKRQNSVIEESEVLVKHEEIENIAGKIVEQMSKLQQKQEDEVAIRTEVISEEIAQSAEEAKNAIIWQSQVKVEQTQIQQQSEVLKAVSGYLSEMEMERRKWSTFLQKPKCSKPVSKFIEEPKKSTYKVVIRTKKDLEAAKKAAEEEAIREAEEAARALEEAVRAAEEAARAEEEAARAAEEAERIAFEEAEARLQAEHEMEQRELDENENVFQYETKEEDDEHSRSEATSKHMSGKDAVVTVEQQLAQVKEQLLALSELPSTIQMTLSIITEQLQKLAQEAQPLTEDDFRDDELSNADNTETEDEVTELLVLESQEALSVVDEESENMRADSAIEVMEEEIIDTTKVDEEDEARRLEEAKIAKKEKEKMQQQPLTPLERPIILPGGRKWVQPDDAVRSVRQSKLSDDKIDETISSYYEVNHWNEIWPWTRVTQPVYRYCRIQYVGSGDFDFSEEVKIAAFPTDRINFLKYQPPPKNLDHLQQSEVYKMVHDLEPPPRGIKARPEKIPAVQDYLVKTNGEEDKQLPAQMER